MAAMWRAPDPRVNRPRAGRSSLWLALLILVLAVVSMAGIGRGQTPPPAFPALSGRVVDGAGLIGAEARARLTDRLAAHEAATGDQLVIATVTTLGGLEIEDYANRLHRHWRLGTAERNNGVLLLVAPAERKVRIEVGYGLEGGLTDALARTVIAGVIAPRFREGRFEAGIEAGTDALLAILKGDAETWQRTAAVPERGTDWLPIAAFVFVVVMLIVIVGQAGSRGGGTRWHRQRNGRWVRAGPAWGTGGLGGGLGGSAWGSGLGGGWSGGSGGGSGGFSGGGGSSGGGGASGSW
jgi:uncharacterized protein